MNYKFFLYITLALSALLLGAQITFARITNPTIVGTVAAVGNQDMGSFNITNAGTITGTSISATSTTATSTFNGALFISTSTMAINTAFAVRGLRASEDIIRAYNTSNTLKFSVNSSGDTVSTVFNSTYNTDVSVPAFRDSGNNTGMYFPTTDNIGLVTNGVSRLNIDATGSVGIASTTPWRTLSVVGTVAMNGLTVSTAGNAVCILGTFDVVTAGNTTCVTSSQFTKKKIKMIEAQTAKNIVLGLVPRSYTNKEKGDVRFGFIAEQALTLDPRLVEFASEDRSFKFDGDEATTTIKKGSPSGFDYLRYTAVLTQFVQNFYAEFQSVIARISGVEDKLNAQQSEIELLKARLDNLEK